MLSSSIIAIIIVRMIFICSFLVECLLCNHTFQTNPNKYNTNPFFQTYISLVLIYQSLYIMHIPFDRFFLKFLFFFLARLCAWLQLVGTVVTYVAVECTFVAFLVRLAQCVGRRAQTPVVPFLPTCLCTIDL